MSLKSEKPRVEENKKSTEKKDGKKKAVFNQGNRGEKKGKKKMRFELKSSQVEKEKVRCEEETGVKREMSEKSQMLTRDESCPQIFGVRSYLHNFYESVSIRNPQLYEDIYDDEMLFMNKTKKDPKRMCWKVNVGLGAFILGVGVVLMLVGYLTPLREGITSHEEGYVIIDQDDAKFNKYIKVCRMAGLVAFCSGGCLFSFALLLSFFFNTNCGEEEEEEPLCVTLHTEEEEPHSPTDKKIPATEELASVQPKRETEQVVVTHSGLCKPPKGKSFN